MLIEVFSILHSRLVLHMLITGRKCLILSRTCVDAAEAELLIAPPIKGGFPS